MLDGWFAPEPPTVARFGGFCHRFLAQVSTQLAAEEDLGSNLGLAPEPFFERCLPSTS
jgi:hypothetical protein